MKLQSLIRIILRYTPADINTSVTIHENSSNMLNFVCLNSRAFQ